MIRDELIEVLRSADPNPKYAEEQADAILARFDVLEKGQGWIEVEKLVQEVAKKHNLPQTAWGSPAPMVEAALRVLAQRVRQQDIQLVRELAQKYDFHSDEYAALGRAITVLEGDHK